MFKFNRCKNYTWGIVNKWWSSWIIHGEAWNLFLFLLLRRSALTESFLSNFRACGKILTNNNSRAAIMLKVAKRSSLLSQLGSESFENVYLAQATWIHVKPEDWPNYSICNHKMSNPVTFVKLNLVMVQMPWRSSGFHWHLSLAWQQCFFKLFYASNEWQNAFYLCTQIEANTRTTCKVWIRTACVVK